MTDHAHCPSCGHELPREKKRTHERVVEVAIDAATSSGVAFIAVLLLRWLGL